ncbi:MAG: hypothetical protein Q4A41_00510 [Bacillota bacterium]|nr:hypothetical protein [Bacillota bacterium]
MICKKCNSQVSEDVPFCSRCGNDLKAQKQAEIDIIIEKINTATGTQLEIKQMGDMSYLAVQEQGRLHFLKSAKLWMTLGILLVLGVSAAFFLFFWKKMQPNHAFVYATGNRLIMVKNMDLDQKIDLNLTYENGTATKDMFGFSKDGRYFYFLTDIANQDQNLYGTLKRVEVAGVEPGVNIAEISQEISTYVIPSMKFVDGSALLYYKRDKNSGEVKTYYFDGEESHFIEKGYKFLNEKGVLELIAYDTGKSYIHAINLAETGREISVCPADDLLQRTEQGFAYKKEDNGRVDLYSFRVTQKNAEPQLIAEDVVFYAFGDEIGYYALKNRQVVEGKDLYSLNLYAYRDGKSDLISDRVLDIHTNGIYVSYNTIDLLMRSDDFINEKYQLDFGDEYYILPTNSSKSFLMLPPETGDRTVRIYPTEERVYMISHSTGDEKNKMLSVASVGSAKVGDFYEIIKGDIEIIGFLGNALYYKIQQEPNFYTLYVYEGGENRKIDQDLSLLYWVNADNRTILARAQFSDDIGNFMLYDTDGNRLAKMDAVSNDRHSRKEIHLDTNNHIYYISDYDLYLYDGGEKTKIDADVDFIICKPGNQVRMPLKPSYYQYRSLVRHSNIVGEWKSAYLIHNGVKTKIAGMATVRFDHDGGGLAVSRVNGQEYKEELKWTKVDHEHYEITTQTQSGLSVTIKGAQIELKLAFDGGIMVLTKDLEQFEFPEDVLDGQFR